MKFYRLDKRAEAGISFGYEYFTTLQQAQRAYREWMGGKGEERDRGTTTLKVIDVVPTRKGILSALNIWASHPDNG